MSTKAKTSKEMAQHKQDYVKYFQQMFSHIKPADMTMIVNSIFNLLWTTDKVATQPTKPARKEWTPEQKATQKAKKKAKKETNKAKKENVTPDQANKQGQPVESHDKAPKKEDAGETPQKAAQQKQKTPAGYAETDEDVAFV